MGNSDIKNKITLLIIAFFFSIISWQIYAKDIIYSDYLIDNFEDNNIIFNPEWFQFGDIKLTIKNNYRSDFKNQSYLGRILKPNIKLSLTEQEIFNTIKKRSLSIKGKTSKWYIGGLGTYLGIDVKNFNAISLYIKGNGPESGRLKIELFDDDDNTWSVEQDPNNNFLPLFDDKWVYEININWKGWRKLTIPFKNFKDENPGIGDDIFNPYQEKNSGGLIQIQIIALSPLNSEKGKIDCEIDELSIIQSEKQ